MERVNKIINHIDFKNTYLQIENIEKDRIYCKHDFAHLLDVARLAWIFNLEESLNIPKDILYAASMLHDIGKLQQYLHKIPHEIAGCTVASTILFDCGFTESEYKIIISAIETHRDISVKNQPNLNGILYRADKLSRKCFVCKAKDSCNWSDEKKNLEITY